MRKQYVFCLCFFVFILQNNTCDLSNYWVYFSPKDKISEKLIDFISCAKTKVYAAVYWFTDLSVANALIRAKLQNGVDVQIVTDKSCIDYKYNKIQLLKDNGIQVFVFKPNSTEKMHNKFVIIDNKVWTGSYNLTRSADYKNQENVLCTNKQFVCKKYEKEFSKLKRICYRLGTKNKRKKVKNKSVNCDKSSRKLWPTSKEKKLLKDIVFDVLKKIKNYVGGV